MWGKEVRSGLMGFELTPHDGSEETAGRVVEVFAMEEEVFEGEFVETGDEVLIMTDKVDDGLEEILEVAGVTCVDAVGFAGGEFGRVGDFEGTTDCEEGCEEIANCEDDEAGVNGT